MLLLGFGEQARVVACKS